jgi:polyhydroxyalkanoate synthase
MPRRAPAVSFAGMTVVCPSGHGPTPIDVPLKLTIARLSNGISPASLAQAGSDWFVHLLTSPSKQMELAASAARGAQEWSRYLATSMQGLGQQGIRPSSQDRRFARHQWNALPWSAIAQGFLLQQQWWSEATQGVRGVSAHHEEVVAFVARQWLDMWSPSNFVATNPQVLSETWKTGGRNLVSGFVNWSRDATALAGRAPPRGVEEFRVGESVAITPGKVVMRNHFAEVLQYEPSTPRVDKEPVLIVPSWIMKFYILDLTPQDSLVKYLVEQGHTVFMVSWRNPGSEDAGLGMQDYLRRGVIEPIEAVRKICRTAAIHAMGYCLGGTLLAIAAAMLAGQGHHVLKTITLLAGQVDFEEPGELGLFIDESQIAFLEDLMTEHGYLDGVQMAGAFQLINSRDPMSCCACASEAGTGSCSHSRWLRSSGKSMSAMFAVRTSWPAFRAPSAYESASTCSRCLVLLSGWPWMTRMRLFMWM